MKIYFSDFFEVDTKVLEEYGAFNISLINDLPLFIDPFLIYSSTKVDYNKLHESILDYLCFLKTKSAKRLLPEQISSWYTFAEVKQNWFGYSLVGNSGRGLGYHFGVLFSSQINRVFGDLRKETITGTSHIEQICLFRVGVGKDSISDFTTNLIKKFLLDYTHKFASQNIDAKYLKKITIEKVVFDYNSEVWISKEYNLPFSEKLNDYVLLTPKDILTKDNTWINNNDLVSSFDSIKLSLPNKELRRKTNAFYDEELSKYERNKLKSNEKKAIILKTIEKFPELIKYYIKQKELNASDAKGISEEKVNETYSVFVKQVSNLAGYLSEETDFYTIQLPNRYDEDLKRANSFKQYIEKNNQLDVFYQQGKPLTRESDLHIIYRLIWFAASTNESKNPKKVNIKNNIEFKLASNSKLKQNLKKYAEEYLTISNTKYLIKIILYFDKIEYEKVTKIIKDLGLQEDQNIILIDASL